MSGQGYEQLTLFPGDSRASLFPLPGSEGARKMTATSGRKWSGLSKNSGPLGLLEKMLLESLSWHSPIYYLSWRPKGIGQGHFLFQLALSEPDTGGTGSQLWATPTAQDYKRRGTGSRQQGLPERVVMYNTPTAQDAKNSAFPESQMGRNSLVGNVMREMRAASQTTKGGQLNPDWVEWLMGFPVGWTDIGAKSRTFRGLQTGSRTDVTV